MRLLPVMAALLCSLSACSHAEQPKLPAANPTPKLLQMGDTAPPLNVTKWLRNDPITKFEAGKVYVVDFWATWCGPCIQSMPHLDSLYAEYKDKGLNVIAMTSRDDSGNTLEKVNEFIEKGKGKRMTFTFAFADNQKTYIDYMEAAGREGIPCSFVVDQKGKIAFIGHPMELDEIVPRILAGTWKGKADLEEIQASDNDLTKIMERVQEATLQAKEKGDKAVAEPSVNASADSLKLLEEYEKKYPLKADNSNYLAQKIVLLLQAKQYDNAKGISEKLLKKGIQYKSTTTLNYVRALWVAKNLNPERKNIALSTQACEEILKIDGEDDLSAVMGAAHTYYSIGEKKKADEFADKARKIAASSSGLKDQVEKALKSFQE